jgi:hypothetical protein
VLLAVLAVIDVAFVVVVAVVVAAAVVVGGIGIGIGIGIGNVVSGFFLVLTDRPLFLLFKRTTTDVSGLGRRMGADDGSGGGRQR